MISPDKVLDMGSFKCSLSEFKRWSCSETTLNLPARSRRYAGQARALSQIDIVVRAIAKGSAKPFKTKQFVDGTTKKVPTTLGERVRNVLPLTGYLDGMNDYEETIAAFLAAVWHVETKYQISCAQLSAFPRNRHDDCVLAIEELVSLIRVASRKSWYMRCKSDREYKYKARREELERYVRKVISERNRTLVVRVDLTYERWARKYLSIDEVYADLDRLRSKMNRGSGIFANLVGQAYCLEHARGMGYHVHAAFLFDGNMHRSEFWKGKEIGELWKSLVQQGGHFHVCRGRDYGIHDGIGMVRRDDAEKIQKCVKAISYLAKPHDGVRKRPSFLLIRPHGCRTYWTGLAADVREGIGFAA
jgi:hypothetical protein